MLNWFRKIRTSLRHTRAEEIRQRVKRKILLDEVNLFFTGKRTSEESLNYRLDSYARLDAMSDDEILEVK